MRPFDDDPSPTPDERFHELAGILAEGILRLHERAALPTQDADVAPPEDLEVTADPWLEVPAGTRLSVHVRSRSPRVRERSG
jgi:hypothetical protein